jgi:hypothetical protein
MVLSIFAMATITFICSNSILASKPKPAPKPDEELGKAIATVLKALK